MARAFALFTDLIAPAAGAAFEHHSTKRTFQFKGDTSSGAGAAEVDVEVSNDGTSWEVLGTITLVLGVTVVSDSIVSDAAWKFMRGNLKSISGTNAKVTLTLGAQ